MNQPVPEDGLSAFFDEEVSPSEEREIRRQLAQSAEAQQELAEIRRLSGMLRQLPKEPSPPNLLANVMNQTDGKSAFPAGSVSRRLLTAGVWLAGLAALVMAAVWIPSVWNPNKEPDADRTIAANSDASEERGNDQTPSRSLQSAEELSTSKADFGDEAKRFGEDEGVRKFSSEPPSATMMAPPADRVAAAEADSSNARETKKTGDLDWEKLARAKGDRVIVVEVAAADVPQAMARLRFLLAQENVGPADSRRKMPSQIEGAGERSPEEKRDSEALYVQSTGKQIQAALAKWNQQNPELKWQEQTALALKEVPELQPEGRGFGGGEAARFGGRAARVRSQVPPTKEAAPKEAPAPPSEDSQEPADAKPAAPSKRPAPSFATSGIENLRIEKPKAESRIDSFQMPVPAPTNRFRVPADPKRLMQGEAVSEAEKSDGTGPKEVEKGAEGKDSETQPVRVIFVFRQQRAE